MILPDHEIRKLAQAGMITPFNDSQLNPASYNVQLGVSRMFEVLPSDTRNDDGETLHQILSWGNLIIAPGEFVLAATMEKFNLPDNICAQFALRSSWARKGLEHSMAGFCDPGWHDSVLTMELKNNLRFHPIVIPVGECIGQMVFFRMESKPEKSYAITGRYNNDIYVRGAK